MRETKTILLVGVGGQGTILAGKILSAGLLRAGYDVKMSEIHGMSQRGGSVSSQIRFGEKVYSPIAGRGEADVIIAFEKMEALRFLDHLREGGKMIVNDYEIPSVPILTGAAKYPQKILEELEEKADVSFLKAADIAEAIGDSRTMNMVLLGALVKALGDSGIHWEGVIAENVKKGFEEINIKAFREGQKQV